MAQVYADLVRKGAKTIDDVPERYRDAVRKILGAAMAKRIDSRELG